MARHPRNVFEMAVARAGVRKGARVCGFIACWCIYVQQRPGEPSTVAGYCRYWREPERTVHRYMAEFREVFPALRSPDAIAQAALAQRPLENTAGERSGWWLGEVELAAVGIA